MGAVPDDPVRAAVLARIRRRGPIGFDELLELALYDDDGGFYSTGAGAGRRGHFVTSPELGPLFGAVVARALDDWWDELGRPDPFVVVEGGAGRGALAAAVLGAAPRCGGALRYVLVERSPALRARQAEALGPAAPTVASVADLDEAPWPGAAGVVLANELLDNLPFALIERGADGWLEVRVGERDGQPVEAPVPAGDALATVGDELAPDAPVGGRVPVQGAAVGWVTAALGRLGRGRLLLVDYADTSASMAARPWRDWLRTYRGHERGGAPLDDLGGQDVTCEVAVDQLARVAAPAADRSQADWLRAHGLDVLVAEARATWHERAAIGDLAALRARSRVGEADALSDPAGLGAFRVLEWVVG